MAYIRCNDGAGTESPYIIEGLSVTSLPTTQMFTPTDAYKGNGPYDYVMANCPSLSEVYSIFYDTYLNREIPNYSVTKKSLGKDQSYTYDLFEYDFCPDGWERMILLSSGMNGYEVAAIFGLAYFLKQVIENHDNDPVLNYIFRKVRIKVIPFINPWGYAQSPKVYLQSRGVNLNRNFDINGKWAAYPSQPGTNNYKGEAPFSEAETQILRNWTEENLGAEFWIDCHTACSGATENKEIFTSSLTSSPNNSKLTKAHNLITNWTKAFYGISNVNTEYRYDSDAALKTYWYEGTFSGRSALTLEQCSDCPTIGLNDNGSSEAIYNYFMLLYGCVGCYLDKADVVISDKNSYITELTQDYKSAEKYYIPCEIIRPATLISITATKTTTRYSVGDTLITSDIVTTAHYADGTSAVVNGVIDSTAVDMSVAGTYAIGVSYTEDGVTVTTTITIEVSSSVLTATLMQGGLDGQTGQPVVNNARIYTSDYLPIIHDSATILNAAGNGKVCFIRAYKDDGTFVGSVTGDPSEHTLGYYYVSGNSGATGVSDTIQIQRAPQGERATRLRIAFAYEDRTTPISPSDLAGTVLTIDGVQYALVAGE